MTNDTTTGPETGRGARARGIAWLLAGIGALVVILLAAILIVLWSQASDDGTSKGSDPEDASFKVTGSLQLIGDVDGFEDDCFGSSGYSDLRAGAQVIVRDADGKTVGIGALGKGTVPKKFKGFGIDGPYGTVYIACAWRFEVTDVPNGSESYSVEVAHRGEIAFTEENSTNLALSLGS